MKLSLSLKMKSPRDTKSLKNSRKQSLIAAFSHLLNCLHLNPALPLPSELSLPVQCNGDLLLWSQNWFLGVVTCSHSTYQVPWVGWPSLRGGAEGPGSASPFSSSAWPLPGAHSILPPLVCQAELEHPEPHCLPTLYLSRHLGSMLSCSACHGCQGDTQGPAAAPAVHLHTLWLHQEPVNRCASSLVSSAQPSPLHSSPALFCGCDGKRHRRGVEGGTAAGLCGATVRPSVALGMALPAL